MYKDIYNAWINSAKLNEKEIKELNSLVDEKDIEYRFGKDVEFGTAGMRGLLGLGTNMMNVYTVKRATQALADLIKDQGDIAKKRGVVISYDTRRCSYDFAYASAVVLATNGIKAYMFDDVRPVPMLSYAVKQLKAFAGIMITASHNPKEYNGYKVYGEDGAQMSPENTAKVVANIDKIGDCLSDAILYDEKCANKIKLVSKCLDRRYYKTLKKLCLSPKEVKEVGNSIKLIYTPVHGSGYIPVTTILKKIGIKPILVPEQINKDTEFSTVEVPNPEYKETLSLGIKMADFKNADIVFGTDPDCDRLGVAIRNNEGEFEVLSGNQVGVLILDYILKRLNEEGKLSNNGFVVKSFVSTSMARAIADDYDVDLFETPVGFKFIGEKIKEYDDTGKREYIFGFEESCGYLRGTHCRDKDAVVASMLFAEMACYYTYHNKSIYQRLCELYEKYGYTLDVNDCTVYKGLNAMTEMTAVVDKMKTISVDKIGGFNVVATRDYSSGIKYLNGGIEQKMDVPKNNAVYYELEGGSFVCLRPSGTEPKLKTYYSVKGKDKESALKILDKVRADFEKLLTK